MLPIQLRQLILSYTANNRSFNFLVHKFVALTIHNYPNLQEAEAVAHKLEQFLNKYNIDIDIMVYKLYSHPIPPRITVNIDYSLEYNIKNKAISTNLILDLLTYFIKNNYMTNTVLDEINQKFYNLTSPIRLIKTDNAYEIVIIKRIVKT